MIIKTKLYGIVICKLEVQMINQVLRELLLLQIVEESLRSRCFRHKIVLMAKFQNLSRALENLILQNMINYTNHQIEHKKHTDKYF